MRLIKTIAPVVLLLSVAQGFADTAIPMPSGQNEMRYCSYQLQIKEWQDTGRSFNSIIYPYCRTADIAGGDEMLLSATAAVKGIEALTMDASGNVTSGIVTCVAYLTVSCYLPKDQYQCIGVNNPCYTYGYGATEPYPANNPIIS